MIFLRLYFTFIKFGLFGFGGGYAILSLMKNEFEANGWVNLDEFANLASISQMTPGPIAINAATYVGYTAPLLEGYSSIPLRILGSLLATAGIVTPSFFIVIIMSRLFVKFKDNQYYISILKGIRPVTIGMIAYAVWFFASISVFTFTYSTEYIESINTVSIWENTVISSFFANINVSPGAIIIAVFTLIVSIKYKLHPVAIIIISALLGLVLI